MLLLFDLDDTLIHSVKAYDEGMRAIGIDPKNAMFLRARDEVKEILGTETASSHNRTLYFKRLLELEGKYSAIRHLELVTKYEEAVARSTKSQWLELKRDGLFSTLSSKHRLFIITNETARMQALKMQAMDPHGKYFSGLVTSEEAGAEKPAAKIFDLCLQRCKVTADQVVMIGDSYKNDIAPAIERGMRAFQTVEFINKASGAADAQSFQYIEKLDQLIDLV